MAIVARFSFDVPFGRKAELFELFKKWEPVARDVGFPKPRVVVGSIGAPESRVEQEYVLESLAQLETIWGKLGDPRAAELTKALGAFVVPGSHRWEILRVQEL